MDSFRLPTRLTANRRIHLGLGIWAKIILPYFLLTLVIAGVGTFVLTNLVTSSLQDRINNQLIDAGRIVSTGMVQYEQGRLQTLRAVANTEGVAEAVVAGDSQALAALVPQIIANSNASAVELVDINGLELYGWQQPSEPRDPPVERSGADLSRIEDVQLVLNGVVDEYGDKRVFLSRTPEGVLLFTVGPLKTADGRLVGAVLVGSDLRQMTFDLTLNAVARVTFYDRQGNVLQTTLGGGQEQLIDAFRESPERYAQIIDQLQTVPVAVVDPENQVPLRQIELMGQSYQLAFGDWRLRNRSFGMFSVALPRNFLITTMANSRNLFLIIFSLAIVGVFTGGFVIARRLTRPIHKLVQTATAVTEGNLDRRSGIQAQDEIGRLAAAFDTMTETLAQRNRQLLETNTELSAIVDSIADGVIVMNNNNEIATMNPAAKRLLADMSHDFLQGPLRELSDTFTIGAGETEQTTGLFPFTNLSQKAKRFQVGSRVMAALGAPMKTPNNEQIGSVVVLRDVTREAEAESLKDAFITNISHELRTPLTMIKVYSELMIKAANGHMNEQYLTFIQNINKGSLELEHHINQLINISELQAGTLNLNRIPLDFADLVGEAAERWQQRMAAKELSFTLDRPGEPIPVLADIAHMTWAVDKLLSNAHNYTPNGGKVHLRVYRNGEMACLDVVDTGIGIAAADQPHLFDRFFRAHNVENYEARGVGLGLYIALSVVKLHDGFISVESKSRAGSTFTISLPLAKERQTQHESRTTIRG